ncbi:capsule assembly Wzi family protein [Mucilaginibacter sp. UR6-11]|uniref:capsule assembly Wzi family protein n=1 Tax=Mucilaginibacter sp. UR6-11 TaxID=1435644 RepID=UPI001E37BA04|nr:capsule assembly Wzi family protein [Mucilaginibacter sp. UR6-11]MCC8423966.1 capsule assembly Wzi family protein [Mucilaginibacter sp. UR6-11]
MKKVFFVLMMFCLIILGTRKLYAQSIPVGTPVLEDYYRREQLLGKVDSNLSFAIRPLLSKEQLNTQNILNPDSSYTNSAIYFGNKKGFFQILPFSWQQQFNSDHPYGWNDGAMIPAKGYQTLVSSGFYLKYGVFSIQFKPEFVYAANNNFNGFDSGHPDQDLIVYYSFHNSIDLPEKYGNGPYKKAFLGQSSIRLTFGKISLGFSNENLWWGPGINNALVLTNNAAGFKHLTINTVAPIKTAIGNFEGQVIAGRLEDSGYPSLPTTALADGRKLYIEKRKDWRYFTGFNLNYNPKYINGLTLGIIRTFNAYYADVKTGGFNAYVPFFTSYTKQNVNQGVGDLFPRDQITSLYARWLMKKAQAEVYFEYGWEDNLYNLSDFIQSPEHSRAYIFGFRKLLPVNEYKNQHILIGAEITQTSQHTENSIREVGQWYLNYQLLHGHTNDGQVLGAGTGPGGNLQSFDVSWVDGLKKIGIGFDRFEHDVDFYQIAYSPINGNSRNWVDFALSVHGEWNYKHFLFNAKLQQIKSLNYQWILKDYNPGQYYIPHNDVYNFHGELGITYRF